jgi:hypothetical protein
MAAYEPASSILQSAHQLNLFDVCRTEGNVRVDPTKVLYANNSMPPDHVLISGHSGGTDTLPLVSKMQTYPES